MKNVQKKRAVVMSAAANSGAKVSAKPNIYNYVSNIVTGLVFVNRTPSSLGIWSQMQKSNSKKHGEEMILK